MRRLRAGFTIVEMIISVIVISILASILLIGYGTWQHHTADSSVQSDLQQATSGLRGYQNFKNDYPPNLGGVGYAPSDNVILKLYTNASQIRVYSGLSASENAQLFLNTCNALMPIVSGGVTYNTSCSFAGNNIHVSGTTGSNIVWNGPNIQQSDVVLTCGSACTTAAQSLISKFTAQGGSFPVSPPKQAVPLPAYSSAQSVGSATRFCLEGDSVLFSDIAYHATSEDEHVVLGPCPSDPTLHYP